MCGGGEARKPDGRGSGGHGWAEWTGAPATTGLRTVPHRQAGAAARLPGRPCAFVPAATSLSPHPQPTQSTPTHAAPAVPRVWRPSCRQAPQERRPGALAIGGSWRMGFGLTSMRDGGGWLAQRLGVTRPAAAACRPSPPTSHLHASIQLCKDCFYGALEAEVHDTITTCRLFSPGERVAIAASGAWLGGARAGGGLVGGAPRCGPPPSQPPTPPLSPNPPAQAARTRPCWPTC